MWTNIAIDLVSLLLLYFLVYVGAGSILGWGLRHALRQLGAIGTMATRALPLLVLVVMFSFFGADVWQMAYRLDRWQLWLVVAFLAILAVLFMVSVHNDELREMARRVVERDDVERLIAGTPLAGAREVPAVAPPLSRSERANVTLVLFVAQAMQIVILSTLVFCLFMVLGTLTMKTDVIASWVHLRPDEQLRDGRLFGLYLPVTDALVQVSIFLSVFSGLYFAAAAAAASDPQYRRSFFEPLLDDVRVSLAARQVYLAQRPGAAYAGTRTVTTA